LKYFLSLAIIFSLAIKPISQKSFSLDTLLVQTTRIPLKASETGRSISILTKEQIQQLPATTFYELLQTICGVEVQSRGGFGVQGDIVMRGSTFSQVLVLIDGMKINDPLTGHFNCYVPVSNMEIERIEILKGAGASMYGPDAVGGVINIITKGFDSLKNGTSSSGAINYGDNNLISSTASVFHKANKFYVGLGLSINKSDGNSILPVALNDSTKLEGYKNYFDIKNVSLSGGYKINDLWELKFRSSILSSDFNARYFYTSYASDKSTEITSNWFNRVQLLRKTEKGSILDINASYKRSSDEFLYSPASSTNIHKMDYINFTVNNSNEINNKLIFKSGIQGDLRKIESNDRGNHSDYHFGAYFMGVYKSNNLVITTVAREDYDENYGFEFCPQINAAYNISNVVLRASAGKSIRAADYTERYNNNLALKTYLRLGNPNLIAERGWSEEIGINYYPLKNTLFKTTIFSRQSNNIIDYILTNESEIGSVSDVGSLTSGADYLFARNIKDVNVNGFEVELNTKFLISESSTLDWQIGYTYTDITNDNLGIYLSSFAKHLVNSQVILKYNSFQFSLSGLFKERTAQAAESIFTELKSSYALLNARLGYGFLENKLSINIQILNLTDTKYQNILGAKMPGRWLMGGISWNFN
jgi:vitamin B12 transporter